MPRLLRLHRRAGVRSRTTVGVVKPQELLPRITFVVEELPEARRNCYSLTAWGRTILAEEQRRWRAFTAAVDRVLGGDRA